MDTSVFAPISLIIYTWSSNSLLVHTVTSSSFPILQMWTVVSSLPNCLVTTLSCGSGVVCRGRKTETPIHCHFCPRRLLRSLSSIVLLVDNCFRPFTSLISLFSNCVTSLVTIVNAPRVTVFPFIPNRPKTPNIFSTITIHY